MTDEVKAAMEWCDDNPHCQCCQHGSVLARTVREQEAQIASHLSLCDQFAAQATEHRQEIERLKAELRAIEEYGTSEINAAVELRTKLAQARLEIERLRTALAHTSGNSGPQPASGSPKDATSQPVDVANRVAPSGGDSGHLSVKSGPCETCRFEDGVWCRKTAKTDGVHCVMSYVPCAWLGGGCYAWEAR